MTWVSGRMYLYRACDGIKVMLHAADLTVAELPPAHEDCLFRACFPDTFVLVILGASGLVFVIM
jgi:hypothetical protein